MMFSVGFQSTPVASQVAKLALAQPLFGKGYDVPPAYGDGNYMYYRSPVPNSEAVVFNDESHNFFGITLFRRKIRKPAPKKKEVVAKAPRVPRKKENQPSVSISKKDGFRGIGGGGGIGIFDLVL